MATAPITDDDERLHPVEDPSPHWSDSLYFNAWDPATNAFLMTRIAVRANEPAATAGMIVWVDGMPVWGYGHDLTEVPPTDWDVMPVGAITYRMLSSCQTWAVQVADGDHVAHLEWDGLSPATHYNANPNGPLPRPVAWGHYEQTCRVTGDLRVGGQSIRFDGFGQRDHSWGFRHWAGLDQWHWVTCFFEDGRSANLFEVHAPDGSIAVNGFVHGADGDEYVVAATRTLDRSDDGGAERYAMELALADGSTFAVTAERGGLSLPVRPAPDQPVVVHETPMRLTAADGTRGYGIYEHLVRER
ncbi:MAG: hypothetical protein M3Z03_10490 [Actinomycetota bacterium]|nr:hypothetical protein [Actinomycetota bacterium]